MYLILSHPGRSIIVYLQALPCPSRLVSCLVLPSLANLVIYLMCTIFARIP